MVNLTDEREPIEQLAEDFLERLRCGEGAAVDEYADTHPDQSTEIRDLFPTMLVLEKLCEEAFESAIPEPELAHPRDLGDLQLVRELGRGGMGVVYEAMQESLGRRVAVKVLPGGALENPRLLERFKREARTAAILQHPHIVPVFGVGEVELKDREGSLHYLVMQIVDGVGLDVLISRLAASDSDNEATVPALSGGKLGDLADELASALAANDFTNVSSTLAQPFSPSGSPQADEVTIALSQFSEPTPDDSMVAQRVNAELSGLTRLAELSGDTCAWQPASESDPYWRAVAQIIAGAADAVGYAHESGTLHRDIKPGNLLLDRRGHVWVTDFGLAKAVGGVAAEDNLSRTGELVGTLRYMAPEHLEGKADERSDLYSLGLTLYELITWRPAYGSGRPSELVRRIMQEDPTPPRSVCPCIPRDLETIVLKASARDPADRYPTGAAMADDLRRFAAGEAITARRESPLKRATRWARKNLLVMCLAVAVVMLGASTLIMLLQQGNARPLPPAPPMIVDDASDPDNVLPNELTDRAPIAELLDERPLGGEPRPPVRPLIEGRPEGPPDPRFGAPPRDGFRGPPQSFDRRFGLPPLRDGSPRRPPRFDGHGFAPPSPGVRPRPRSPRNGPRSEGSPLPPQ